MQRFNNTRVFSVFTMTRIEIILPAVTLPIRVYYLKVGIYDDYKYLKGASKFIKYLRPSIVSEDKKRPGSITRAIKPWPKSEPKTHDARAPKYDLNGLILPEYNYGLMKKGDIVVYQAYDDKKKVLPLIPFWAAGKAKHFTLKDYEIDEIKHDHQDYLFQHCLEFFNRDYDMTPEITIEAVIINNMLPHGESAAHKKYSPSCEKREDAIKEYMNLYAGKGRIVKGGLYSIENGPLILPDNDLNKKICDAIIENAPE